MKIVSFGIKSEKEVLDDFVEASEAAMKRLPFKPRIGVFFTSLESARNFLTPKRVELLRIIKHRQPRSVYELAKFVHRSFPSVLRDVDTLVRHGLVKVPRVKNSPRRAKQPRVDYDAINIRIGI